MAEISVSCPTCGHNLEAINETIYPRVSGEPVRVISYLACLSCKDTFTYRLELSPRVRYVKLEYSFKV